MPDVNSVTLLGRVANDLSLDTDGRSPRLAFRLTVRKYWTDAGGMRRARDDTFLCVAFGRTAELIVRYADTGSLVLVHGQLEQARWTDRDGRDVEQVRVAVHTALTIYEPAGSDVASLGDYLDREAADANAQRSNRGGSGNDKSNNRGR